MGGSFYRWNAVAAEPLGTCKSGFLKTLFLCLEYFSEVIYNKKSNYSDFTVKGTEQLREKYNRDMGANMKNCKRIVFICLLFLSLTSLLLVPARTEAATQNSAEATVKKAAGKWIKMESCVIVMPIRNTQNQDFGKSMAAGTVLTKMEICRPAGRR